jgi:type I restriction enzyme S subunit
MKKGWQTKTLGEICDIERGGSPRPIQNFITNDPNGINWIKIGDATASGKYIYKTEEKIRPEGVKRSRMVYDGDFILSNSMSFGRPYIMKTTGCIHDGWLVLHQPKVDPDYLYYVLSSDIVFSQFDRLAAGSTVRNLNIGSAKSVEIPYPPLPEQQRIVGVLDEAFASLATAQAHAAQNLQNARALFESHLQSVFTQRGPGWVEKSLGEVADLLDCLHKTPIYAETGFPMVRVTDIKPGFLDLSKTRKVDEQTFNAFSKGRNPKAGDIVFSRVGSCGVSAIVNSDEPFCLGQNTVFILPKINSVLLYHFLNSPNAKEQFEGFIDGTTQPTISMKSIRQVAVPIAPPVEHDGLVAKLDSMREETQRLESIYQRKLAAIDELKKSLLHQAFSGEL